ncbi:hypothetical protein [Streptomyces sp. CAU 1734]|uniref:hypothetical protein n=1 Tax=Streptomyces sp. CAU 1734 TaxID=3140360 RepID=UPI003260D09B
MSVTTLPRHPLTGLTAVGWRRPRPGEDPLTRYPIWPVLGAADDDGDNDQDDDGGDDDEDDGGNDDGQGDEDTTDYKAEAEKYKAMARKHERRAKANAGSAAELAKLKREGMSETEKSVAEAVAAARAEEKTRAGVRVARSTFLAAAAGKIADAAGIADDLRLNTYVDDDGEVDEDAITELVGRLVKAAAKSGTDTGDGDDGQDGADTGVRRRRRQGGGFNQGAGRRRETGGTLAEGAEMYKKLLGGQN